MNTTAIGRAAEAKAADYLAENGYKVVAANWRTRYCEIDIVAQKDGVVYFVEVKYRNRDNYGSGSDYVSNQKLRQMSFAAELWVHKEHWTGQYQLAVIEVSGPKYQITAFLTEL